MLFVKIKSGGELYSKQASGVESMNTKKNRPALLTLAKLLDEF